MRTLVNMSRFVNPLGLTNNGKMRLTTNDDNGDGGDNE